MLRRGPHRSSEFAEKCRECGAAATEVCFRCNVPWCESHRGLDPDLCSDCDEKWLVRKRDIELRSEISDTIIYVSGAVLPALGIWAGVQFGPWRLFATLGFFIGVGLAIPVGVAIRSAINAGLLHRANKQLRAARDHFLDELREGRLLVEPDEKSAEDESPALGV